MKKLILPLLLALIGLGGGVGAGIALRPQSAGPHAAGSELDPSAMVAEGDTNDPVSASADVRQAMPQDGAVSGGGGGSGTAAHGGTDDPEALHDTAVPGPCGLPSAEIGRAAAPAPEDPDAPATHDYVKLNNQFIVPIVGDGRVTAMVILSLSLEVRPGSTERVYVFEPKLRDVFLQVLFDHANAGGFDGAFTGSGAMNDLRSALLEAARKTLGTTVSDILIADIVRQDS